MSIRSWRTVIGRVSLYSACLMFDRNRTGLIRRRCQQVRHMLSDGRSTTPLEVSVVGSFSRIGPAVRSPPVRLDRRPSPAPWPGGPSLVTGPTSGLGLAAAGRGGPRRARRPGRAQRGAAASASRTRSSRHTGADRYPGRRRRHVVARARSAAAVDRILATETAARRPGRQRRRDLCRGATESPDGIEATLALLVVGPFALEAGLLPLLAPTPGVARDRRHLGRDVRAAAAARRPRVRGRATTTGRARLRAGEAGPGRPRARVGAADRAGRSRSPRCTRAGPTRRGSPRSLPGFHRVMRPLLRSPAQGHRHDRLARDAPGRRPRSTGACSSTGGRGRSTASRSTRLSARRPAPALGPRRRARAPDSAQRSPAPRPDQARRRAADEPRPRPRPPRPRGRRPGRRPTSTRPGCRTAAAPPTATSGTPRASSAATTSAAAARSSAVTTPITAARARVRATASSQPSTVTSEPRYRTPTPRRRSAAANASAPSSWREPGRQADDHRHPARRARRLEHRGQPPFDRLRSRRARRRR